MALRRRPALVLLVVLATVGVAFAGSAAAKEEKDTGLFALVPRLGGTRPPSFVGVDSAGRLVGVALTGEGELVAYVCDGEGTGVWFEGTFEKDATTATLKGKNGATLTLDLTSDPLTGTVTIGGSEETDRKSTRLNSSHIQKSRMPSSA